MKLALAGLIAVCAGPACGGSPCGETEGTVTRIVDGDTIELSDARKIRLLLVDTPETTGGQDDCYGQEAKQFTTDTLLNKQIELEFDVECTDRYGRTLAYVTVDGQEINKLMIQRGYACVLHISPDGDSRVDEFKALQLDAQRSGRGLWSACNPLPPACE